MNSGVKQQNKSQTRKFQRTLLLGFVILAIITTVGCAYGHAARESDLFISGVAGVRGIQRFTSTYMQDLTPTECANADVGIEQQLTDRRDGKRYWVTKMQDGNCWMVQNLDFDIPATINTDGITTDVPIANYSTGVTRLASAANWNSTAWDYSVYIDPGDYYYAGPNDEHGPGSACTISGTNYASCAWLTTTGDAHYHLGNYYSASAASFNSSSNLPMNQNGAYSVCPAGWQLPESGTDSFASGPYHHHDTTYANLLESYGWTFSITGYTTSLNGGSPYNIYDPSFYFSPIGYVSSTRKLEKVGDLTYYISRTSRSATHLFTLYIRPSSQQVSVTAAPRRGDFASPVRCLFRGN